MNDCLLFPLPLSRRRRLQNADGLHHLSLLRDSVILILRLRQESVAAHEYARPNIGASITRANSGNGALPTRELEQGEKNETKSRHASEA